MFYSKTQNVLLLVKWKKKPIEYILKKLIFFILFIRTSDLFFQHEKIKDD